MTPEFFLESPLKGALKLLPAAMDSPAARAMVIAICLQESQLRFRRQVGGPARGYAQFEQGGGVRGVLAHPTSMTHAKVVCASLDLQPTVTAVYPALEQNDVLVAAFARLLLWTLPDALPTKDNPEVGWQQYIAAWRPGKPHRETWDAYYAQAWAMVEENAKQERIEAQAVEVRLAAIQLINGLNALRGVVESTVVDEALPFPIA